jgi:hypothetical protein
MCGDCDLPLVPIRMPDVLAELRRRARLKQQRPDARKGWLLFGGPVLLALVAVGLLLYSGLGKVLDWIILRGVDGDGAAIALVLLVLLFLGLLYIFVLIIKAVTKALGFFPPVRGSTTFNPDRADVPALLAWLGLTASPPR